MTKVYPICGEDKPWSDFGVNNSKRACTGGIQSYCKPCARVMSQVNLHSMSLEQFNKLLEIQEGLCAVCKEYMEIPFIDHDHNCCPTVKSCGHCTRGLLCRGCNSMLGFARDNPDILKAGADYLITLKGGD